MVIRGERRRKGYIRSLGLTYSHCYVLGWLSSFDLKKKTHFPFSLRTFLCHEFTVLFHYLLPFFRQLHNSISPKLFIFLSKELFQVPFTVFQGVEISPLREFCKDQNKRKSEGTMAGEYGGRIRTSSQSVTVFAQSSKKHVVLHYLMETMHFLLTNSGHSSSSAALSWSNQEQYLLEFNCLVHQKELITEDSLAIPPYTQHHLPWKKIPLVCDWWWFISLAPTVSSIPHYCTVSTFQHPSQFVLKMEHFYYISVEKHM